MDIVKEIEQKYRNSPQHGIIFSIDAKAYDSRIGDRILFGESYRYMECGTTYNWQNIYLDMSGNTIGVLEERQNGKLFDPMTVSFCIHLADCMDKETWDEMEREYKGNPHLVDEGETLWLKFATLNQLLDHLNIA